MTGSRQSFHSETFEDNEFYSAHHFDGNHNEVCRKQRVSDADLLDGSGNTAAIQYECLRNQGKPITSNSVLIHSDEYSREKRSENVPGLAHNRAYGISLGVGTILSEESDALFIDYANKIETASISIHLSPFLSPTSTGCLELTRHSSSVRDARCSIDVDDSSDLLSFVDKKTEAIREEDAFNIPIQGILIAPESRIESPLHENSDKYEEIQHLHGSSTTLDVASKASEKKKLKTAASRQPQKRYSLSRTDSKSSTLFGSKFTTNTPREVRATNIITGERIVYVSCSEAARKMKINRTKISRICRAGGGRIDNHVYQYVDLISKDDRQKQGAP